MAEEKTDDLFPQKNIDAPLPPPLVINKPHVSPRIYSESPRKSILKVPTPTVICGSAHSSPGSPQNRKKVTFTKSTKPLNQNENDIIQPPVIVTKSTKPLNQNENDIIQPPVIVTKSTKPLNQDENSIISPFIMDIMSNPYTGTFAIVGVILFIAGIVALGIALNCPQSIAIVCGTAIGISSIKILAGFAIGIGVTIGTGLLFFKDHTNVIKEEPAEKPLAYL